MPTYEMPMLLRIMKQPEVVATLKRTAQTIFNTGGFIRKIENWGVKQLPCKTSAHGQVHRQANHFLICFEASPKIMDKIMDEYNRDIDIVRVRVFKQFEETPQECTFHEEMLPPPYRPSVQKLMELAKKQHKNLNKFKYNSGLDYYPFSR